MIALAQLGQQLIFTKAQYGDGTIAEGEDQETFLKLKQAKLDLAIQSMKNPGTGQIEVTVLVDRTDLIQGFFGREIGLFAKVGEAGTELLFCYTNAGNLADYIPSKDDDDTPYHEFIDIEAVVGNSTTLTVVMDDTKIYVTKEDLDKHNKDLLSHEVLLKDYVRLTDFTKVMGENGYWKSPDGFMMQWGVYRGKSTVLNDTQIVIPFLESFATISNAVMSDTMGQTFAGSGGTSEGARIINLTTSNISIWTA